jgi:hypothetical protein
VSPRYDRTISNGFNALYKVQWTSSRGEPTLLASEISFAHASQALNQLESHNKSGHGTTLAAHGIRKLLGGSIMVRSGKLVAAASFIVSMHASADSRPPEPFSAAQTASDMSDAYLLAERHLALYRVSRAAALGWRDSSPESTPASVHTSVTAPLPLPREPQRSDTEIISAQ